jgi:hypothetical protein
MAAGRAIHRRAARKTAHPTISGMVVTKACTGEKLRVQWISGGKFAIRKFVRECAGRAVEFVAS